MIPCYNKTLDWCLQCTERGRDAYQQHREPQPFCHDHDTGAGEPPQDCQHPPASQKCVPARFRATVVMSALYMARGSWTTEPSLKAGPVVDGPTRTVQSWSAASSSCRTRVRTCMRKPWGSDQACAPNKCTQEALPLACAAPWVLHLNLEGAPIIRTGWSSYQGNAATVISRGGLATLLHHGTTAAVLHAMGASHDSTNSLITGLWEHRPASKLDNCSLQPVEVQP